MYEITCDKCNGELTFDHTSTVESCIKDLSYIKDTISSIQDRWLSNYLVYTCIKCNKKFKYTFKDVELKVRETVSKDVMAFRKTEMFKNNINIRSVDPDNGLLFCGQCDGVDGEGNCYIDVIKQCTIKV